MKKIFNILKKFRVIVALVVFVLISAKFLDVYNALPKSYYQYFNPIGTQFTPSLLKMFAVAGILSGAGFITFTLLALLFGRIYCSFFCTFGILMDILRRIATLPASISFTKKTAIGKYCQKVFATQKYAKARNVMRTSFLAIAILSISLGYLSLLGFIDPYSLYGKIMGCVVNPTISLGINETSQALYSMEIFALTPVNGDMTMPLAAFGIGLLILIAITIASAFKGRLYCNTICPVGTFLGFISKFSLFKIRLNKQKCISCGLCERNCKTQCINAKEKSVDFSRCVVCFNCAKNCPKDAVEIALSFSKNEDKAVKKPAKTNSKKEESKSECSSMKRRDFPKALVGVTALASIAAKKPEEKNEQGDTPTPFGIKGTRPDKRLPMPPGAKSMDNFLEHCTACQLCVASCKSKMLRPSLGELGVSGLMQPYIDFSKGYCIHECHDCSKVCPTGAIDFITSQEKQHTKIGTAIFQESLCVVCTNGSDCSACGEHCPVSAIEMLPYGDPEDCLFIPHVHAEVCIGCGACEYICPVMPHKAIVIQGIKEHRKAVPFEPSMRLFKPEEYRKEEPTSESQEGDLFPF